MATVMDKAEDNVDAVTRRSSRTMWVDGNAKGKRPWSAGKTFFAWLLPFAAFLIGALAWGVGHIEGDLEEATIAELETQFGIEATADDIDFDYRSGTVNITRPAGVSAAEVEAGLLAAIQSDGTSIFEGDIRSITVTGGEVAPVVVAEPEPAPPATGPFEVTANGDGSTMVLDGTVLSEAHRAELVAAAALAVGTENVVDNLTVSGLAEESPGADEKISEFASLIANSGSLLSASGSASDGELSFTGAAVDLASADQINETSLSAYDSAAIAVTAPAPEPEVVELTLDEEVLALQAEIDALQAEIIENVVFAPDSDEITQAAAVTLDKVGAAMNRYQKPVVLVGGHTDADGAAWYNTELSDRRAKSVAAYLVDQGVDNDRLTGTGFGEGQPVAPNDTETNKQKNRRVAFTSLGEFAG